MTLDRPSLGERYETAADTSDLTLHFDRRSDADILLAAGYAAAGNVRGTQALMLYRMRATGDRSGVRELARVSSGWLMGWRPPVGVKPLRRAQCQEIAAAVIHWWFEDSCSHCHGRRYELVPGTNVVSDNLCHVCNGAGKEPVDHRLRREHQEAGRWLANQFEDLMSYILADMAKRLRSEVEL